MRLEEGIGKPLTISLVGEGTDEKIDIPNAAVTNAFRFPFAGKAKGDYVIKAGGAKKRVRNLPFQDGEIWIDENGVARRNGEKFMPFGFFSDTFVETTPGLTVAQTYDGHLRDPQVLRRNFCDVGGRLGRIIVASPTITEPDGRKLFDTKAQQGPFTDAQKASIRRFADAVKDHPWFGAYYLVDEPEGRDLNPEWFRQEREFLAEIDPYHPTMMLNYSIEGTVRYSVAGAEINCPDAYPYYFTDGTTRSPRRVAYDKAKAAATHAQCAWLAPQLFDWPTKEPGKVACAPDFDEIREQALLALAGDARGLLWYTRYSYGGAFTEHMRHGPRLLLEELLETRDVFLSPTLEAEWMLDSVHGQYYDLKLSHAFELVEAREGEEDPVLALEVSLLQGLANSKYNEDDLGCDCWGFRDTTLAAELSWRPCALALVKPYIAYSDHLNGHFRHPAHYVVDEEASHHVAQLYGGIAVELSF